MSKWEEQEKRIAAVLGEKEAPGVAEETLGAYLEHLRKKLELPCLVTGIEDFEWEEYYILGPGDQEEYEELRKTRPSYRDTFELLGFEEEYDEDYGLYARLKRVSDRKRFVVPLEKLKAKDPKSPQYALLDDYAVWFVNYRE